MLLKIIGFSLVALLFTGCNGTNNIRRSVGDAGVPPEHSINNHAFNQVAPNVATTAALATSAAKTMFP